MEVERIEWMDLKKEYYGELEYHLSYKGQKAHPFKWLYLDFERLKAACIRAGLHCEKITQGKHFDYLARITVRI